MLTAPPPIPRGTARSSEKGSLSGVGCSRLPHDAFTSFGLICPANARFGVSVVGYLDRDPRKRRWSRGGPRGPLWTRSGPQSGLMGPDRDTILEVGPFWTLSLETLLLYVPCNRGNKHRNKGHYPILDMPCPLL